jgi:hypothetical protein
MTSKNSEQQTLLAALAELRTEIAGLASRVAALEESRQVAAPAPSVRTPEELIAVASAAIAAFLGVRPQIKQIRLVGDASWVQQGRATIQASHALTVRRG